MADFSVGHLTKLYELLMLGFELGDRMLQVYRVSWEGIAVTWLYYPDIRL
jgi:hypothetical protein